MGADMHVFRSQDANEYAALERLEAALMGKKPQEARGAGKLPRATLLFELPATGTIDPPLTLPPSRSGKQRRGRFVGTLTLLAGLTMIGATWLSSGGNLGNFAASAATVTAAISQHLSKRL